MRARCSPKGGGCLEQEGHAEDCRKGAGTGNGTSPYGSWGQSRGFPVDFV